MHHNQHTVRYIGVALCVGLFALFNFKDARCQCLEGFVIGQQMSADETPLAESTLEVDASFMGGFGAGFGLGRINMNLDFLFGATDIRMGEATLHSKLSNVDINLDYNLLKSSFTPLLSAGIGSMTFSESFTGQGDFMETDVSYNFGAGVRWNVARRYLIKILYRTTITKIQGTDDSVHFNGMMVGLGYSYRFAR